MQNTPYYDPVGYRTRNLPIIYCIQCEVSSVVKAREVRGFFKCTQPIRTSETSLPTTVDNNCPRNFDTFLNGSCYMIVNATTPANRGDARASCEGNYSHLVIIDNQQENDFLHNAIDGSDASYWIGAYGIPRSATWSNLTFEGVDLNQSLHWDDGSMMKFHSFHFNIKDTFNSKSGCYAMNTKDGVFIWRDLPCFKSVGYICEYEDQMKVKPCPADVHVMKLDNGTWIPPLRSSENSTLLANVTNIQMNGRPFTDEVQTYYFGSLNHFVYRWADGSWCSLQTLRVIWNTFDGGQLVPSTMRYTCQRRFLNHHEASEACRFLGGKLVSASAVSSSTNFDCNHHDQSHRLVWVSSQLNETTDMWYDGDSPADSPSLLDTYMGEKCAVVDLTSSIVFAENCQNNNWYACQRNLL
ncbi:uncharacterized protein [Apostichopus japonicus]|uniref:uncharacterized protein isoform X2 n=1 Tax=Stichopus japonicus TaxID=307972 RepID=UPI003AB75928